MSSDKEWFARDGQQPQESNEADVQGSNDDNIGDDALRGGAAHEKCDEATWRQYCSNRGHWDGRRYLYDPKGIKLLDIPSSVDADMFGTNILRWTTQAMLNSGNVETEEVEWTRDEVLEYGVSVGDGSFSIGPRAFVGEQITVEQCLRDGDKRVRATHAFDWEGNHSGVIVSRERVSTSADPLVSPSAWRSSSILFDYLLGTWEGTGVIIHKRFGSADAISSKLRLSYNVDGDIVQRSALNVTGGPSRQVEATAQRDGALLTFAAAGAQMLLLQDGVSLAGPMKITRGFPFVVEAAFLTGPDVRKRVARCYNSLGVWVNTVFIDERRVSA